MAKFTHLHTHSHYSLLDGLSKVPELVAQTRELGMDSLALTDHGVLYGSIEFYKAARKAGIKPILGVETYVAPRDRFSKEANERYYHLILLAENSVGWNNLMKLVSKAHLEGFYYKPRVDRDLLREHHEGLIALSGCLGGEIGQCLLAGKFEEAKARALEYREIFGVNANGQPNYFLEIQKHPNVAESEKIESLLVRLSAETGIPLVATQDSHYIHADDAQYHDVLLAVQTGNKLSDDDRMSMKEDDFSLLSPEAMLEKFASIPGGHEAVERTAEIAARCNVEIEIGKVLLPDFPKPAGKTANGYLRELIEERMPRKIPSEAQTKEVHDRLEYELSVIEKTGFADYFLIVQDLIQWAKAHGIAVGPGRGSAAGSLISYLLDITDIDPLRYNLLFERFLNPERIQMPDIDIDFADTRRDEVLAYAREKYGEDHVARIITFGTMAARAAIRDAGRAMGYAYAFCDQIAKLIPFNPTQGMKEGWLDITLKKVPELKALYDTNPDAKKLIDTARHLEGVARHASVHACATVISQEPLTARVPVQFAPQDKDTIITQFEMHAIEDLGLLKIDFLGLKNLTIIESTLRIIKELHGTEINISKIPLDDKKAFELLQAGDTTSIFQFECLSGETLVAGIPIKRLFEKQNKARLRSVYLDEGKVHKNKVLGIAKSGVKDVYALIAENGRYIKASAEHMFMTDNGWKKLKELQSGDQVLMQTNGGHLLWNTCKTCGKQINGQKNCKAKFCYQCSAVYYSNPSKTESREAMRVSRSKFFADGGTTWNKGITTENNEIWKRTAEKISKALTGRTLEEIHGPIKAAQMRARMSVNSAGSNNPMFGKPSPHRKGGYRDDLGHYVRSSWEADFARVLNLVEVKYEYEPKTFELNDDDTGQVLHYTPDFYVPEINMFYEIKGWFHELDQKKVRLFQEQYPEYDFTLIHTTKFAELEMEYKDLVAWECPQIPKGFEFIKIREIKPMGQEETYDIAMEAPGNNFMANSFVVHNSSGMRRYMKDIKPTELEDLIALVALFRPGPMELIPTFIARKQGKEPVRYIHPVMEETLKSTYGIIVYQEQVMDLATKLAGLTRGEGYVLIKAVGKKIKSLLDEQKTKFINGCLANKIPQKVADQAWELIEPFARYGFNKAHSACYAMIGYRTAYLKANYPEEFTAAVLNSEMSDVERISVLIQEAKSSGVEILPPDINKSFVNFTPEGPKIRFGLLAIKNVGSEITRAIIEERSRGGPFTTFEEVLTRIQHKDLNKKSLESMVKSGVFDSLGIERKQALENMDEILKFAQAIRKSGVGGANSAAQSLFGGTSMAPSLTLKLKPAAAATNEEKLAWEKELIGFYLSEHPLNAYQARMDYYKARPIAELASIKDEKKLVRTAGMVSKMKKIFTKSGQPMIFATIEDAAQSSVEVVVFNSVLEKTAAAWEINKPVILDGRVSRRDNELKIICENAKRLVLEG